jgi:cation-transporting ATPase 13A1
MAASSARIDDLVQSVSLYNPRRLIFNGYILPFLVAQFTWVYCWVFVYGVDEYYEAGLVGIAAIGVLHIFLCLCCQWSVHIQTFLNCSSVSGSAAVRTSTLIAAIAQYVV